MTRRLNQTSILSGFTPLFYIAKPSPPPKFSTDHLCDHHDKDFFAHKKTCETWFRKLKIFVSTCHGESFRCSWGVSPLLLLMYSLTIFLLFIGLWWLCVSKNVLFLKRLIRFLHAWVCEMKRVFQNPLIVLHNSLFHAFWLCCFLKKGEGRERRYCTPVHLTCTSVLKKGKVWYNI